MALQGERTKALYQKGKQYLPYGVNSNFRYWGRRTRWSSSTAKVPISGIWTRTVTSTTAWGLVRY